MGSVKAYKFKDPDQPEFSEDFEVAQHAVLQVTDIKTNRNKYYAVELHIGETGHDYAYRVFTHYGRTDDLEANPDSGQKECRYFSTLGEAEAGYEKIYKQKTSKRKGYKEVSLASSNIGSVKARGQSSGEIDEKTLERIESDEETPVVVEKKSEVKLSKAVRGLVRYLYDEAVGAMTSTINAKVTANGIETPLGVLTIGQIEKGEEILEDIYALLKKKRKKAEQLRDLSSDFYTVIPHRFGRSRAAAEAAVIDSLEDFQTKQETLQLMKDMLKVNGGGEGDILHNAREEDEYTALGCDIQALGKGSKEFKKIARYVVDSQIDLDSIEVQNVFRLSREEEQERYCADVGNDRLLFHGSRIQNWVGILSRGILLPKVVVNMGIERTDEGWLGNGIYFGDASCTGAFYATEGTKGTAFMAVAKVALGKIKEFEEITYGLTSPPKGFDSCHGVRGTEFEDDEFVVYSEAQQKLEYLVEFSY